MMIRLVVVILALSLTPISLAADSSLPVATARYWAEGVDSPDPWEIAAIPWFTNVGGDTPVTQQTELRVAYDYDNLYISFRCAEREMPAWMSGNYPVGDDFVEVCLDVNNDRKTYYRLRSNALGLKRGGIEDGAEQRPWDGDWKVETGRRPGSWSALFTIPFKSVGLQTPAPDASWGLNLARYSSSLSEASSWSRKGTVFTLERFAEINHDPAKFGRLIFGGPDAPQIGLPVLDIASPGRHGGVLNYDLMGKTLLRVDILNNGRQSARLIQEVSGSGEYPFGILLPQEGPHAISIAVFSQGKLIVRTPELPVIIPAHRERLKGYMEIVKAIEFEDRESSLFRREVANSLNEMQNTIRAAYGSNEAWAEIAEKLHEIEADVKKLQEMSKD